MDFQSCNSFNAKGEKERQEEEFLSKGQKYQFVKHLAKGSYGE